MADHDTSFGYPPGFEIGYTEVTSPVNITDTSESTASALIAPGALMFDGGPVICEFFAMIRTGTVGNFVVVSLFEGSTQLTEIAEVLLNSAAQDVFSIMGVYRFTPSAGLHTYKITAYASNTTGTPRFNAGAGGVSGFPPAFVRFIKV